MAKKESTHVLAARQKVNEFRRQQERTQRRRRALIQTLVIAGAVLAITVIVVAVILSNRSATDQSAPNASSVVTIVDGADVPFDVSKDRVRIGADDAAVTVSLYEDYSCPHCQDYAAEVGDTLTELVASGDVAVEYHPMRVVTNYGNRAGSAATCVAVGAPESFLDVHAGLFALHDATTDEWSDAQFGDYLAEQRITDDDVLECVRDGRYANWIDENTETAREAGITSTPTLLIDGQATDLLSATELRSTVDGLLAR